MTGVQDVCSSDLILGATGGGHEEATGAMVPITDFEKFKDSIKELTKQ